MKAARRAGVTAGAVLLAAALVADAHGQLQARMLLWIAAGLVVAPAAVHAFMYGRPAGRHRAGTAGRVKWVPQPAPPAVEAAEPAAPPQLCAVPAPARRELPAGRVPSPRPLRQLTR